MTEQPGRSRPSRRARPGSRRSSSTPRSIIHLKDREGRYLLANAETEKMFGFDPALAIGKTPQEVFPAVDELSEWGHREVVETGRVVVYEEQKPKIGPYEWSHVVRFPLLDDKGEVAVVGCIAIDITERKRAETALRESEARLQALMEHAPLVVHLKDREGRYVLANPEAARIFGRPPAEVMGKTPFEVFPPEEAEVIDRHHREVLESGRSVVHEEFQPSLDAYQWSLVVRFPIRDAKGEVAVVGGFALDITERKRAEEALKASEARLAAFMEHAPVGMYLKGLDGRYLMLNPETGRVFGRPAERDAGPPAARRRSRRRRRRWSAATTPRCWSGASRPGCEEYLQGREAYGWSLVIRFPVRDATGRIVQIGGFDLDITAQKRALAELAASERAVPEIAESHRADEHLPARARLHACIYANRAYPAARLRPEEVVGSSTVLASSTRSSRPGSRRSSPPSRPRRRPWPTRWTAARPTGRPGWGSGPTARSVDSEGRRLLGTSSRPRPDRATAGRGGGRAPARGAAPEREADGAGLAPGRGRARAQQPALGRDRLRRDAARHGPRRRPRDPRRARSTRRPSAAPGSSRPSSPWRASGRRSAGRWTCPQVVASALELAAYGLRTAGVTVAVDAAPGLPLVWGDADQLHQVLVNLIVNAQQALVQSAPPRRLAVRADGPGRRRSWSRSRTTGPACRRRSGSAPSSRSSPPSRRAWAPASASRSATASSPRTAAASRSRASRAAAPLFRVTLPVAAGRCRGAGGDGAGAPSRPPRAACWWWTTSARSPSWWPRRCGRTATRSRPSPSGRAALARLARGGIDLVVSDLRMPDLDGPALVAALAGAATRAARRR